jgi:hypothetical protein
MPEPTLNTKPFQTLQQELATAIRQDHASLNKLLSSRLPLCLPPHTSSTYLFTAGLTVFGHLYTGFEAAWSSFLSDHSPSTASSIPYLSKLHTPGLSRHTRLHEDLQVLRDGLTKARRRRVSEVYERTVHIHARISALCTEKPHLILAYAWTLYLALFNGGRYIRAALEDSGPKFWGVDEGEGKEAYPLAFWRWKGEDDGVAIEEAFRNAFDVAAEGDGKGWKGLGRRERDEVVEEARAMFTLCHELVGVLDRDVGGESQEGELGARVQGGLREVVVLGVMFDVVARGWRWFVSGLVALGRACGSRPEVEEVSA